MFSSRSVYAALSVLVVGSSVACQSFDSRRASLEAGAAELHLGSLVGHRAVSGQALALTHSCLDEDETAGTVVGTVNPDAQNPEGLSAACPGVTATANSFVAANGSLRMEVEVIADTDLNSFALAELQLFDTYTVTAPGGLPNQDAQITLRAAVRGCAAGSFAQYEMFARLHSVSNGQVGPPIGGLFGGVGTSRSSAGTDDVVLERTHTLRVGDTFVLNPAFDFVLAVPDMGAPRAAAVAEVSVCSETQGVALTSVSGATGNCVPLNEARVVTDKSCEPAGDLILTSVEPVQSVFGTSSIVPIADTFVDLVANKPMVVTAEIQNTFTIPQSVDVTLIVNQPWTGESQTLQQSVTVPAECSRRFYFPQSVDDPAVCDPVDGVAPGSLALASLTPSGSASPGNILTVDGSIALSGGDTETDLTNNETRTRDIPIKETALSISYVKVSCLSPSCVADADAYGEVPSTVYDAAIETSNRFMVAMFPVTESSFAGLKCEAPGGLDCFVSGSSEKCIAPTVGCRGEVEDLQDVFALGKALNPNADRYVAVVPCNEISPEPLNFTCVSGYFPFHNDLETTGRQYPDAPHAVLADVSLSAPGMVVVGHEILHSYDIPEMPQLLGHKVSSDDPGHVPFGYWVDCQGPLGAGARCDTPSFAANIMDRQALLSAPPPVTWIDSQDYQALLTRLQTPVDPPLLILTGTITQGDVVTLRNVIEVPGGTPSRRRAGPYSLDLINAEGDVAASQSFGLSFTVIRENRDPSLPAVVEINETPVTFAIPYPVDTVRARITKNGATILEFDPLARTLRYAIERIPDRAFTKKEDDDSDSDSGSDESDDESDDKSDDPVADSAKRRAKLLKQVETIENLLGRGRRRAARGKLATLRRHVERDVGLFDYRGEGETTRTKALQTIDQIISRLNAHE